MPAFFTLLLTLIVHPPTRELLFPHAPLAIVDSATGGLKKPAAGTLGSVDSLTGAPEAQKGEAVEQEAHSLLNGLAAVLVSTATGKTTSKKPTEPTDHDDQEEAGGPGALMPDLSTMVHKAGEARVTSKTGKPDDEKHNKAKAPLEEQLFNKMQPLLQLVAATADGWERWEKYGESCDS